MGIVYSPGVIKANKGNAKIDKELANKKATIAKPLPKKDK